MLARLFFVALVALLVASCGKQESTTTSLASQPGTAPVLTTIDLNNLDSLLDEYERLLKKVTEGNNNPSLVNNSEAISLSAQAADLGARLAIEIVNFNQAQSDRFESINQMLNNSSSGE